MSNDFTYAPALSLPTVITGREPELSGARANLPPLIVHVDDNTDLLTLVYHVLNFIGGYRVQSFKRGQDAFEFCQTTTPNLLITDVIRPGMDGHALCRAVRSEVDLRKVPIVVFSACSPLTLSAFSSYGVTFLPKPCTWQDILSVVEKETQRRD